MKVYLSGICDLEHDPLYLVHFKEAQEEMELMGFEVYNHTLLEYEEGADWMCKLLIRLVVLEQCDAIYLLGKKGEWSRYSESYIEYLVARQLCLEIMAQQERPRNKGHQGESNDTDGDD